jgi:hypothetical protein
MAALVGFSRLTLSAHFVSDVFVGGALGYSVSRFAVLQQQCKRGASPLKKYTTFRLLIVVGSELIELRAAT